MASKGSRVHSRASSRCSSSQFISGARSGADVSSASHGNDGPKGRLLALVAETLAVSLRSAGEWPNSEAEDEAPLRAVTDESASPEKMMRVVIYQK